MREQDGAEWQNVFNNSIGADKRLMEITAVIADDLDTMIDKGTDPAEALDHCLAPHAQECSLRDYAQVLFLLGNYWAGASESRLSLTFIETLVLLEGLEVRKDALAHQVANERENE